MENDHSPANELTAKTGRTYTAMAHALR